MRGGFGDLGLPALALFLSGMVVLTGIVALAVWWLLPSAPEEDDIFTYDLGDQEGKQTWQRNGNG